MVEREIKSVILFYFIEDHSIFDTGIQDIWADFVVAKAEGVRCTNVYHTDLTPEDLLGCVNSKDNSNGLFSNIRAEYESGANIMFVNPVVGSPLAGFILHKFFAN
jgi:hypothetical protein